MVRARYIGSNPHHFPIISLNNVRHSDRFTSLQYLLPP